MEDNYPIKKFFAQVKQFLTYNKTCVVWNCLRPKYKFYDHKELGHLISHSYCAKHNLSWIIMLACLGHSNVVDALNNETWDLIDGEWKKIKV